MKSLLMDCFWGPIDSVIKNQELSYSRKKVIQAMKWLACSHYEVTFSMDTAISDRVLFPVSYAEKNGIEDARFVKFVDDDGKCYLLCDIYSL